MMNRRGALVVLIASAAWIALWLTVAFANTAPVECAPPQKVTRDPMGNLQAKRHSDGRWFFVAVEQIRAGDDPLLCIDGDYVLSLTISGAK